MMSRVTLMHRPAMLSDRPTAAIALHGPRPARDYELTLSAACGQVSVYLSKEELERGVLIGRSPKCVDAGLRAILTLGISRVHLLLHEDGPECRAYDLASTQGTYQRGRSVRLATLEDDGTKLALGTTAGIELLWRRVSSGA